MTLANFIELDPKSPLKGSRQRWGSMVASGVSLKKWWEGLILEVRGQQGAVA